MKITQCCLSAVALFLSASNLSAQTPSCAAVSNEDVASIVANATMKSTRTGCSWSTRVDRYVTINENTPKSKVMPVPAMYDAARKAAASEDKVTDEAGLGDKAFLAIASSGVAALQILKGERLLQVQMWTGDQPTNANLATMRAIAKKAMSKF